jgi:hypothetical protein
MIVIVHQTISMTDPVKAPDNPLQRIQEELAITVVPEDRFTLVPPGGYVIKRSVVFDS